MKSDILTEFLKKYKQAQVADTRTPEKKDTDVLAASVAKKLVVKLMREYNLPNAPKAVHDSKIQIAGGPAKFSVDTFKDTYSLLDYLWKAKVTFNGKPIVSPKHGTGSVEEELGLTEAGINKSDIVQYSAEKLNDAENAYDKSVFYLSKSQFVGFIKDLQESAKGDVFKEVIVGKLVDDVNSHEGNFRIPKTVDAKSGAGTKTDLPQDTIVDGFADTDFSSKNSSTKFAINADSLKKSFEGFPTLLRVKDLISAQSLTAWKNANNLNFGDGNTFENSQCVMMNIFYQRAVKYQREFANAGDNFQKITDFYVKQINDLTSKFSDAHGACVVGNPKGYGGAGATNSEQAAGKATAVQALDSDKIKDILGKQKTKGQVSDANEYAAVVSAFGILSQQLNQITAGETIYYQRLGQILADPTNSSLFESFNLDTLARNIISSITSLMTALGTNNNGNLLLNTTQALNGIPNLTNVAKKAVADQLNYIVNQTMTFLSALLNIVQTQKTLDQQFGPTSAAITNNINTLINIIKVKYDELNQMKRLIPAIQNVTNSALTRKP